FACSKLHSFRMPDEQCSSLRFDRNVAACVTSIVNYQLLIQPRPELLPPSFWQSAFWCARHLHFSTGCAILLRGFQKKRQANGGIIHESIGTLAQRQAQGCGIHAETTFVSAEALHLAEAL
ncbi:MAG: hypothetical protein IKS21_03315, partial [Oscillospiraceae bacterium]|nr:hypothetical protein [Oscillospiraceae bacterium]